MAGSYSGNILDQKCGLIVWEFLALEQCTNFEGYSEQWFFTLVSSTRGVWCGATAWPCAWDCFRAWIKCSQSINVILWLQCNVVHLKSANKRVLPRNVTKNNKKKTKHVNWTVAMTEKSTTNKTMTQGALSWIFFFIIKILWSTHQYQTTTTITGSLAE